MHSTAHCGAILGRRRPVSSSSPTLAQARVEDAPGRYRADLAVPADGDARRCGRRRKGYAVSRGTTSSFCTGVRGANTSATRKGDGHGDGRTGRAGVDAESPQSRAALVGVPRPAHDLGVPRVRRGRCPVDRLRDDDRPGSPRDFVRPAGRVRQFIDPRPSSRLPSAGKISSGTTTIPSRTASTSSGPTASRAGRYDVRSGGRRRLRRVRPVSVPPGFAYGVTGLPSSDDGRNRRPQRDRDRGPRGRRNARRPIHDRHWPPHAPPVEAYTTGPGRLPFASRQRSRRVAAVTLRPASGERVRPARDIRRPRRCATVQGVAIDAARLGEPRTQQGGRRRHAPLDVAQVDRRDAEGFGGRLRRLPRPSRT